MTDNQHEIPSPRILITFLVGALLAIGSLGTLRSIVIATVASGVSGPAVTAVLATLCVVGLAGMYGAARMGGFLKAMVVHEDDKSPTRTAEQ